MWRLVFFLLINVIACVLTAHAGETFTFRIPGDPETLDWNKAHTPVETYLLMNLMEGLVSLDAELRVVPALAESWSLGEDQRTYTFKLKKGVKWSDGEFLKAEHFVYSWKRLLSPLTASSYAYFLFDIEGAEWFHKGIVKDFDAVGVKALGDHTLQIKLSRPVSYWLYIPSFWVTFPLRKDVVEKHGASWEKPGRMVSLGPYVLSAYDHGLKIELKQNPHYYGSRGNIDLIRALIIQENDAALKLYEQGKLDLLTDLSIEDLKKHSQHKDLKRFPYLRTSYLGFLVKGFPISNLRVRRAIAMALDKKKISHILMGGQEVAHSFVPPPLMGFSQKIGIEFNPSRAKAELRASGVDLSHSLSLDFIVQNWDKPLLLARFIQSELKNNLGIEVRIQALENKEYRAQLELRNTAFYIESWSADYPDPDNFMSVFLSTSGNNRTSWSQEEKFDRKILEARNLKNSKDRTKIYEATQKFLLEEEVVLVPLYYEPLLALVKPDIKNLIISPLNYLFIKQVSRGGD